MDESVKAVQTILHSILTHVNAHDDVTADNRTYVDSTFFNQTNSCNNILKLGTRYVEHSVFFVCTCGTL